ncbi:HTTM domain-containing protein [Flavobacterium enshiense]|uniref:HTTM domain-containing protein n=1 Tax=Flavobacterium enshiense DK69 TaxID=1107311 RepID=A0A0A2MXN7_9FLAO|nr:HTTM domain-containing protein [Flavobacterium enshiense]KGO96153.1 HTTM domain-containing protein [Flavobacterium enshiense DK69]
MTSRLFKSIDNAPLIVFRIFFGLLFACETFGAILTGWVRANFIRPEFTFSHIGMDWLQPLPGYGMYFYFGIMGCLSLAVMLGYKYRYSLGLLTLFWAGAYFMQKTSYNNHYYLLLLISFIMLFLPANRYASLDVKQNPGLEKFSMPAWCSWVLVFQVAIVYFFATAAKLYPDWLDGTYTGLLFSEINTLPLIEKLFRNPGFHIFIAYAGIAFDGLIVPLLLWKRTRTLALIASFLFHLFNSIFLKIGIFPYFALSFAVFFYPPETIRGVFFKHKPVVVSEIEGGNLLGRSLFYFFFIPYFIVQLALPIRHWFIKGDVLWTEEGHRLSWRMMLRERSGTINFRVIDKKTKNRIFYPFESHLTHKQLEGVSTKPDMIWQMAQRIKSEFLKKGIQVSIYADCYVSINRKIPLALIDPNVDLASAPWDYFLHNDWILLPKGGK